MNARKPFVAMTVRQEGTTLCYVVDGLAEAPTIRVKQGETLTITLRNEITDPAALAKLLPALVVRDRPVTALPDAAGVVAVIPGQAHMPTGRTNLHMHGFAVPPVAPQDEVLMGCADPASGDTGCGGREIVYHFQIPSDMPAGLYWYHPHIHGEVQAQMLAGLTGALVVEGADDRARHAAGIEDRIFIVRQLRDADLKNPAGAGAGSGAGAGTGAAAAIARPYANTIAASKEIASTVGGLIETRHELGCADGAGTVDEITLNGSPVVDGNAADKDLAPLYMNAGTTQLWRVLNAATDAVLDLALIDEAGKPVPITVIARDGAPLTDDTGQKRTLEPTTASQTVPPAGRVEFMVTAPKVGSKVYFVTHAVDTGCAGDLVPERRLGVLTTLPYTDDTAQPAPSTPATTTATTETPSNPAPDMFSGLLARKTERTRTLVFAEYPRPGDADQTDFYIAERRPGMVLKPYEMSDPPAITIPADQAEEWTVENWTHEIHAFHIHQVHFRVLAINGVPQQEPPLLDTVIVPAATGFDETASSKPGSAIPGAVVPGTVRIKIFFPAALAGDIPFHCHLVDHEDNGMMGVLRVTTGTGNNSSEAHKMNHEEVSMPTKPTSH